MRHGTSNRRPRNSGSRGNGGRRGGQNKMNVFDSNGPDVRIRGTAHQVMEKYLALSKDAASVGDVVLAESYSQHAEHYQRVINEANQDVHNTQNASDDRSVDQQRTDRRPVRADDDLSLPSSILGEAPKASSAHRSEARTPEDVPVS